VAAPTAGLHFTPELLTQLQASGIGQAFITLHVGIGTFRPVKVENVEEHRMHAEKFSISAANGTDHRGGATRRGRGHNGGADAGVVRQAGGT